MNIEETIRRQERNKVKAFIQTELHSRVNNFMQSKGMEISSQVDAQIGGLATLIAEEVAVKKGADRISNILSKINDETL